MKLPTLTILSGERQSCLKLSEALTEKTLDLMEVSFDDPLRHAAFGLFYACDPSFDQELSKDDTLLPMSTPERPYALAPFKERLHYHLKKEYGGEILGTLLVRRLKEEQMFFERFIIPDGRSSLQPDIDLLAREFGPSSCLLVHLGAPDLSAVPSTPPGARSLFLDPSSAADITELVFQFELLLLNAKPETENAA